MALFYGNDSRHAAVRSVAADVGRFGVDTRIRGHAVQGQLVPRAEMRCCADRDESRVTNGMPKRGVNCCTQRGYPAKAVLNTALRTFQGASMNVTVNEEIAALPPPIDGTIGHEVVLETACTLCGRRLVAIWCNSFLWDRHTKQFTDDSSYIVGCLNCDVEDNIETETERAA